MQITLNSIIECKVLNLSGEDNRPKFTKFERVRGDG